MRANNSYCVLTFRFANLGSLPSATAFDTTVRFALVLDLRRTLLKKKFDRWCWLQKCSRALITCSRRKLLLRVIHLKELGDMWKRFESREWRGSGKGLLSRVVFFSCGVRDLCLMEKCCRKAASLYSSGSNLSKEMRKSLRLTVIVLGERRAKTIFDNATGVRGQTNATLRRNWRNSSDPRSYQDLRSIFSEFWIK